MAAAGLDHDGGHGGDGEEFAVELDEGVALGFEDEVNLGEGFVVVGAGVLRDIDVVDGGRGVGMNEGAFGKAAGAGDGGDVVEVS